MANNFDSNFTRTLAKTFLAGFNSKRTLSKNINVQLLDGKFNPDSGTVVDFKRPTDYTTVRTAAGDVSGSTASDIITGKATGTVQNYFTAFVDFTEADQAIKMGGLDQLLAPLATRMCTDLELDFAQFMLANSGLISGTFGTAASTWPHVARAGAVMMAHGVPMDAPWYYTINPYTQAILADSQRSLGAGGVAGGLIKTAHEKATIVESFAGFDRVMTATTLPTFTTWSGADRAGTLSGNPTVTYVGAKDTMTQVLPVTAFTANQQVRVGEVVSVTGRYRLNLSTRQPVVDAAGARVTWTGTVTTAVTLGSSGEGNLTVTGPAIYESGGAYNTTDTALASGDVVTLLGALSTLYQPNLFWHKDAFALGSVPIKRLYSTDTFAQTQDGLEFRVSKYADGDKNIQTVRFDLRPAYACLNPFFAGQGWGY